MKLLPHPLVLAAEEDLAERMPVRRQDPAGMNRHRQKSRTSQPARRSLMVRTAVEAPNPGLRPPENLVRARSDDHFPGRVEGSQSRKHPLRMGGLIRDELDPERPRLAIDPLVECAAHPAAAVVEHLDSLNLRWQFHGDLLSIFSVLPETLGHGRTIPRIFTFPTAFHIRAAVQDSMGQGLIQEGRCFLRQVVGCLNSLKPLRETSPGAGASNFITTIWSTVANVTLAGPIADEPADERRVWASFHAEC